MYKIINPYFVSKFILKGIVYQLVFTFKNLSCMAHMLSVSPVRCKNEALKKNCT